MPQFTHLHVHSEFSILDGATKISGMIERAKEFGMTTLALTDHGYMFGIKEFYDKTTDAGIKPILGCEVYVAPQSRHIKKAARGEKSNYHLIILAKNHTGYKNLMKLVSYASIEGFYHKPRIDKELLEKYHEGLIVSSACLGGEIPQLIMKGELEKARKTAAWFKELFGDDFYLELMRHRTGNPDVDKNVYDRQELVNQEILKISKELGIKYIATNDVHFLRKEDAQAHDILICLSTKKDLDDPKRMRYTGEEYFKSPEEMAELFADLPEALENTMEIASKIEEYDINSGPIMPRFEIPERFKDDFEYLQYLTYEGGKERWGDKFEGDIKERVDFELETIKKMGFPSYFLIVWDFIKKAREMGVSVGPGRGSAAGSAVAYCLKITNIDPVKYDLLFERFLNPDRISMPDIDIDFDEDGRERVLQYVADKYGWQRVAHIVTFGTMAPKMAIRDVGRVLGVPLSTTDAFAKMVPDKAKNFKKAYEMSPEFTKAKEEAATDVRQMLEFAEILDGSARQTGIHACGTIIGRDDLENYIPIMKSTDPKVKLLVTQYDGKYVESVGLLKMDFLGLRTLSIIQDTLKNIELSLGEKIDIDNVGLDDKETYELFGRGDTTGVFQFESDGMKKYLKKLKPNRLEDLIAMNALYRPGPMEYIDDFIARKHGQKKITYFLPEMEEYLAETYGITVYQEQVMLLSRKLAGFTRGQADTLRKAMGKKKKKLIDQLKPLFIEGCAKNNIPQEKAEKIWSDWEAFASYAFNKSHSTCYAYLAYQTGYLKAHYPAQFMAAVMSRNASNISKISFFMEDCKHLGIEVLGPDINESYERFTVNKKGQIRFGLMAVKGLGEGPIEAILRERNENGPFKDVYNFVERINPATLNKRVMEALIYSGALDRLSDFKRNEYFYETEEGISFLEALLKYGSKMQQENSPNQVSLFGGANQVQVKRPEPPQTGKEWTELEKLNFEKEYIGMYLSAHPLENDKFKIQAFTNAQLSDLSNLNALEGKEIRVAGLVVEVQDRFTKNGKPFGTMVLEDFSGVHKFMLFNGNYVKYKNYFSKDYKLLITGKVQARYNNPNEKEFTVTSIQLLDELSINEIGVKLPVNQIDRALIEDLKNVFSKNKGKTKLKFLIFDPKTKIWVQMISQNTLVEVNHDLITFLRRNNLGYKIF